MSEAGEIKFRAWDKAEMRMVGPFGFMDLTGFDDGGVYFDAEHRFGEGYEIHGDGPVFLQFTGLKDKNGKEIYEGDIVHSWSEYDGGKRIDDHGTWEVYWRIDRWHLRSPEYGEWDTGDYYQGDDVYWNDDNGSSKMEVIGNIYENQELLNK